MIEVAEHSDGAILPVRAQAGAKQNAVLGERAGALRVAVTAAPEKGKANAAIAVVIAEALGVKGSRVALLSGETAREKRFLILGLSPDALKARLGVISTISGGLLRSSPPIGRGSR